MERLCYLLFGIALILLGHTAAMILLSDSNRPLFFCIWIVCQAAGLIFCLIGLLKRKR